jgi:hypothetical protein
MSKSDSALRREKVGRENNVPVGSHAGRGRGLAMICGSCPGANARSCLFWWKFMSRRGKQLSYDRDLRVGDIMATI